MQNRKVVNLTSPDTFWPAYDAAPVDYPALQNDVRCDVAVIGGGVTGALVADALVQDGVDTILLDKGEIGGGSTSASTALLLYEIDIDLHQLIPLIGERDAVRAYELCREAIFQIGELCVKLHQATGDDCAFSWKKSWYIASRDADTERLEREYEARTHHGFQVDLLNRADIESVSSFSKAGALVSSEAAQIDVYRLTHRLIQRTAQAGLRVFVNSGVSKYDPDKSGITLIMENGSKVRARHVVFATGYEAQSMLSRQIVRLKSTYVTVSEPVNTFEGWPDRCLIWETARPYLYLRSTEDNRVIVGGEDDPFSDPVARDLCLPGKVEILARRFREMFPAIDFKSDFNFGGTFGETQDGLAYIGAVLEFPHGIFALGFGGNGITYSMIAANIIRQSLHGKTTPDAHIFRFDR